MLYEVILADCAERFLNKCDKRIKEQIADKLEKLSDNPELGKPLTANLAGLWSLRIGDYRAVYQIKNNELVVFVIKIGHRKDIHS
jgi:mRNA interferase RelE/StbE